MASTYYLCKIWARHIINEQKGFKDVPPGLKDGVKQYLIDNGHGDLIPTENTEEETVEESTDETTE